LFGEAMLKFKPTEATEFYITQEGRLAIKQYSHIEGRDVIVFLPPDQAEELLKLYEHYRENIESLWNRGIDVHYVTEDDDA
jgi:hypothetical protein